MKKALEKSERIKNIIKIYKNNENLSIRQTTLLNNVSPQSVINHLNDEIIPIPDRHASYQKLTLIEEKILAQYILRVYESGYPLTIKYLNNCANELLRNKDVNDTINYH